MPILLLTVRGRKTDIPRTAPVRNLRAADHAITEIGGVTRDVTVTVTEDEQREAVWQQILAAYPFFAGYQKKAARQIPVAVLQAVAESVAGPGDD